MRLPVNQALPLAALILLGAAPAFARDRVAPASTAPGNGPAADYPVVVGEPFTIGSTVWTPSDQLNYDAVGQAVVGDAALVGVSAAHKTLPLPCYAEVTALDSGRTILLRLTERGPMANEDLLALSAAAAAQLGITPGSRAPVRVRRVNPPEQERAMLRSGGRAPERMETPEGLLKVLRRKLADQSPLAPPPSAPPPMPKEAPIVKDAPPVAAIKPAATAPAKPPKAATPTKPKPMPTTAPTPAPAATPAPSAGRGSTVVQVGAFSSEANARGLAVKLGGQVSRSGKLWRVRLGPFESRAQAGPALEKAKRAGYSDARIQNAD